MRAIISALLLIFATVASAASKQEIDAEVRETVKNFHKQTSAGAELSKQASGMLVFPSVIKAGIGIGGEFGEGACWSRESPSPTTTSLLRRSASS
jgi:lipid-binding SYLF domain-containing protein